jgi:uncharacterized membrane protein (UPF0127 family)
VIEAHSLPSRLRGLGGLRSLPPDQALQIPTSSVHTFTVWFDLDLIWLSRDGLRVLRIDRRVPRRRIRFCLGAGSVIECCAGRADAFVAALATS